jgi:hypothetical protein
MKTKTMVAFSFFLLSFAASAQWEVGVGIGISLPITGYKAVVKNGWMLNAESRYRFGKGNFAVGMKTQFVRLQKDKDPTDGFQQARMTVAPILFTAEYGARGSLNRFQPYVAGGLGLSFYSLNYNVSPAEGKSVFNVSFAMMPMAGIRYAASKHLYPFVESGLLLIADGPPIGFPKGEKMTGYTSLVTGLNYRF